MPGPHFKIHSPGDQFAFSHPVSETKYTLTVQKLEQQTLSQNRMDSDRWLYPTHFTTMSYTLSPEPDNDISIHDCADNDKPLEVAPATDSFSPEVQTDLACIDIIGGADEPTIILCGNNNQANLHVLTPLYTSNQYQTILNGELSLTLFVFRKKHSCLYNAYSANFQFV